MFFNKKSKNKDIETLLLAENKRLKIENQQLKETLDELERYKQEYKELIETVADLKNDYQTKIKQFDQEGYEDVYYRVQINMLPHQVGGQTVGFDLTVTSDCGYGYSEEIIKEYTLNINKPIRLDVHSDTNSYILPLISLTTSSRNFIISNDSDLSQNKSNGKSTELRNINQTISMDSDRSIITDISSPNDFNWYFLRLVNGVNNITTDSGDDLKIKITYREPRRVIV